MALEHLEITLEEMRNYLRDVPEEDNDLLLLLIESAKEEAVAFLNHDFTVVSREGIVTRLTIPSSVKMAVMRMVASWYEHRDDQTEATNLGGRSVNVGEIPWDTERVLWKYRKLAGT